MINCGGTFRIEERSCGRDIYRRAKGFDVEFDDILGGKRGMDLDDALERRERFALDPQTIAAEMKIASDQFAGVVSGKRAMKLGRITGKLDGRLDGETVRAGDFDAKFSDVTLRQERKSEQENAEMER